MDARRIATLVGLDPDWTACRQVFARHAATRFTGAGVNGEAGFASTRRAVFERRRRQ